MSNWKLKSQNVVTERTVGESMEAFMLRHHTAMRIQAEIDLVEALDLMQDFVDKVDKGLARSTDTYGKYTKFLKQYKEDGNKG